MPLLRINRIAIIGDGGWGTTLALLLAKKGLRIALWGPFEDYIAEIKKTRINRKFLPGIKIPQRIEVTSNIEDALRESDLNVLAIPSKYARQILSRLNRFYDHKIPLLSVTKGIETKTLKRISEIIQEELGRNVKIAVLSGPTIAPEVANGIPTTAVVSSKDKNLALSIQDLFATDRFRIYTNSDVIGVELGGSLKNVIAIACGISDGLKFGTNTKAAILTRGLAEISLLGAAMGARQKTFAGLSGLGDLITTCANAHSRNRYVGEKIGEGRKLKQIIAGMDMIAEGVTTAIAAYQLGKKHNISMPISERVYAVLYKNQRPIDAVNQLMSRRKKEE